MFVSMPDNVGHVSNETMSGVLEVILPDLDQGMTELLDCLRCNLVALDVENIMSQRCSFAFKSGEHGWPVIGISSFILQKLWWCILSPPHKARHCPPEGMQDPLLKCRA